MTQSKIYLASPYSDPRDWVRQRRYETVVKHAAILIQAGFITYSPIAHNHPIAELYNLPKNWDFWQNFDKAFLDWCTHMIVLKDSGWEQSKGIQDEKLIIMNQNKPVIHWTPFTAVPSLT